MFFTLNSKLFTIFSFSYSLYIQFYIFLTHFVCCTKNNLYFLSFSRSLSVITFFKYSSSFSHLDFYFGWFFFYFLECQKAWAQTHHRLKLYVYFVSQSYMFSCIRNKKEVGWRWATGLKKQKLNREEGMGDGRPKKPGQCFL